MIFEIYCDESGLEAINDKSAHMIKLWKVQNGRNKKDAD